MDMVQSLQTFNAGRDPERLRLKYERMRSNPFAFLRASCHLFCERTLGVLELPPAPAVWVCGDLHLENFGSYKGDNRLSYFDINDFDETALAPATWDLLRLLTSLQVAAPALGLAQADTTALCVRFLKRYSANLARGKSRWIERDTAEGPVGALLGHLRTRKRVDWLDSRTQLKGKRRRLRTDNSKALAATDKEQDKVAAFMADFARTQPDPAFFRVLDIARRVAGTGSLGLVRYVILVAGKGSPDGNYLLDLKEARPSALHPFLTHAQPAWDSEAQRIVTVQSRVQAIPMAFLQAVKLGRQACVLRALQASEDRLDLAQVHRHAGSLAQVIDTLADLTAWAQLRSSGWAGAANCDALIDFGQSTPWHTPLLAAVAEATRCVQQDWARYSQAFDVGEFAQDPVSAAK